VPHAAVPEHPQYNDQGQIDYGETVITMSYIRDRWLPLFARPAWGESPAHRSVPGDAHAASEV